MKEDKKVWVNKWEPLKLKHDLILPVAKGLEEQLSTANERTAYLEGLVALQADALVDRNSLLAAAMHEPLEYAECESQINDNYKAISASAETVQAFRDKLSEPLRTHIEEANSLANMQDIAIEQLRRKVGQVPKYDSMADEINRAYQEGRVR